MICSGKIFWIHFLCWDFCFSFAGISIKQWFKGNKTWHFLLHSPDKEMHSWKLSQPCSLNGSSCNVILSHVTTRRCGSLPKCCETFQPFEAKRQGGYYEGTECKSSHWRCSFKKGALESFVKFTGKHLCFSLFLNKVTGWKPEIVRNSYWRCSVKKVVLKKAQWCSSRS